jgi:hypothetical protein
MGLVVYFSDGLSLEPHVVTGYVNALPKGAGSGSIRVRYAQSQRDSIKFAEQSARKDVFEPRLFPGDDWEAPFYRSLAAADGVDAVLLMAGGRSALIAGQIALARRLPVLAVDQFDGSAGAIRKELATNADDYPSSSTHTIVEMVTWLQKQCEGQAKARAEARLRASRYAKVSSQQAKTLWTTGSFLVLLVLCFFGLGRPPKPDLFAALTMAGLIAAGATGALVRSLIWGSEKTPPATSLLLGAIAGFVAGLAYLVPQYVGKYGVLDPNATKVEATDKIQFISAVLVAISSGVGFDTIFSRLRKQAEDQSISPPDLQSE